MNKMVMEAAKDNAKKIADKYINRDGTPINNDNKSYRATDKKVVGISNINLLRMDKAPRNKTPILLKLKDLDADHDFSEDGSMLPWATMWVVCYYDGETWKLSADPQGKRSWSDDNFQGWIPVM